MATDKHITVTGEELEYERPTGDLAAFFARIVDAANDPRITEAELTALVYGKENPLLDQSIFPHHGAVTKAAFADPRYHVLLDLLTRKRVQTGSVNLDAVAAGATMTVAEAAAELGVSTSAVRLAIREHRLAGVKRGAGYMVDPRDVAAYRTTNPVGERGPEAAGPALEICMGNIEGKSFKVKAPGLHETSRKDGKIKAEVSAFRRAAIAFSGTNVNRMFVIEPAEAMNEFHWGPFFIRGRYRVTKKQNEPGLASQWFSHFTPGRTAVDLERRKSFMMKEGVRLRLETSVLDAIAKWDGDFLAVVKTYHDERYSKKVAGTWHLQLGGLVLGSLSLAQADLLKEHLREARLDFSPRENKSLFTDKKIDDLYESRIGNED